MTDGRALGAEALGTFWLVLGGCGSAVLAAKFGAADGLDGIGIGLLLALGAGQLLQGILYGVKSIEPVVLVIAPLILLVASLLASYIPALRATRIDPTVALRSE